MSRTAIDLAETFAKLLVEPAGTLNTGDVVNDKTAAQGVWV